MKKEIIVKKEVNIKYLECFIGGRYWEDLELNGKEFDSDNISNDEMFNELHNVMPDFFIIDNQHCCNYRETEKQCLHLTIDLDNGQVLNWPAGTTLKCYIKSCDENGFVLRDDKMNTLSELRQEYIIGGDSINEYGDYFIADIDECGFIKGWAAEYEITRILEDMKLVEIEDY